MNKKLLALLVFIISTSCVSASNWVKISDTHHLDLSSVSYSTLTRTHSVWVKYNNPYFNSPKAEVYNFDGVSTKADCDKITDDIKKDACLMVREKFVLKLKKTYVTYDFHEFRCKEKKYRIKESVAMDKDGKIVDKLSEQIAVFNWQNLIPDTSEYNEYEYICNGNFPN